ncbi:hypothetical protein BKA80DRAFT_300834 [Phyllosticta citrichinensis]
MTQVAAFQSQRRGSIFAVSLALDRLGGSSKKPRTRLSLHRPNSASNARQPRLHSLPPQPAIHQPNRCIPYSYIHYFRSLRTTTIIIIIIIIAIAIAIAIIESGESLSTTATLSLPPTPQIS